MNRNTPRFFLPLAGLLALGSARLDAQQITWRSYTQSNSDIPAMTIPCIESDHQNRKWVGTAHGGMAIVSGDDWTIYNTANSGIPDDYVNAIAFAQDHSAWIGTGGAGHYGLAQFDGTTWEAYTSSNSPIPIGNTQAVAIDEGGQVWIGSMFCSGGGLISIQGASWTEFNQSNSELPDMWIRDIETFGNKVWIASYGNGLAQYDGTSWIMYNTTNSDIPSDYLKDLAVTSDGTVWLATQEGLASFDGTDWTVINTRETNVVEVAPNGDIWAGYDGDGLARLHDGTWTTFNVHNSELLEDFVLSIEADDFGEVWVGTMTQGISVLEVEGTAVASGISEAPTVDVSLFPVPASGSLTINTKDEISQITFQLSDLTGRVLMAHKLNTRITTIDLGNLPGGHYAYTLVASDGRSTAGILPVN